MILFSIIFFIVGAVFGSFFNVCIYRIPRKESIIFPASYCPVCKKPIKPIHNIPLVSYLLLRGRCAYCNAKIPVRYFFVELITAVLFVIVFLFNKGKIDLLLIKNLIFISASIIIFFTDLEKRMIPNVITYTLMVIGIIFSVFNIGIHLKNSLIGGISLFILILLIATVCEKIKKNVCIGGGDIKYIAVLGFYFGLVNAIFILFMASVLAIFYVLIFLTKKIKDGIELPFGPFLSLSAIIFIFIGNAIISFYMQLVF